MPDEQRREVTGMGTVQRLADESLDACLPGDEKWSDSEPNRSLHHNVGRAML